MLATMLHFYQAVALYHLGRMAEAKSILQDLAVPWAGSGPFATLALVHLATGDTARTREMLERLRELNDPFEVGLALGEREMAFEAFQAVDRWETWPTLAARYLFPKILGPLREDPRYDQLRHSVDRSWGLDPD